MLQLKTPPTDTPVSLAEAKAQCKLESSDEDALIEIYIRSATKAAEQRIGRSLMQQTWLLTLDCFPASGIALPRIPVSSVVSVVYTDVAGSDVTLDSWLYRLSNADDYAPATLEPVYGKRWPATRSQSGAVRIEYRAGYNDPASVPPEAKHWILLQVAANERNREAEGSVQTFALGSADRLLDSLKVWGQ